MSWAAGQNFLLRVCSLPWLEEHGHIIPQSVLDSIDGLEKEEQKVLLGEFWTTDAWRPKPHPDILSLSSSNGKQYGKTNGRFSGFQALVVSFEQMKNGQGVIFKTPGDVQIHVNYNGLKKRTHAGQDFVIHRNSEEFKEMLNIWNNDPRNVHLVPPPTKPSTWDKPEEAEEVNETEQSADAGEVEPVVKPKPNANLCPGGRSKNDNHKCTYHTRKGKRNYMCANLVKHGQLPK